jgi:DNA-binding protein HU-beta
MRLTKKHPKFFAVGVFFCYAISVKMMYTFYTFSNLNTGVPMNKNDLTASVADSSGLTKADAGRAVDAVFESVAAALKSGDEVRIVGFGTFSVAQRAATTGRNPRTGEAIQIAASKQPKFKAGAPLKEAVNS